SQPLVDDRQAAFSRLVSRVIETLNLAVEKRVERGQSKADLARKIGCHRSALTRVLNGTTRNITLKTVSDILWATEFEPVEFCAHPIEDIRPSDWDSSFGYLATFHHTDEARNYYFYAKMDVDETQGWTESFSKIIEKRKT